MIKCIIRLLFILLFFESANASTADTTKQNIKAIEVLESNPFFGESFYRIFHVPPFVIYQSQYQFDSSAGFSITLSKGKEMRSQFFVFHQDSSHGFMFDPHRSSQTGRRLPVDSTLKTIKGGNNFENLLRKTPDTTLWNDHGRELKEVYLQKASKDTPAVRLSFYYSRKLNFLKESLNPVMDSAKKMKLYKYEYLIGEFYSEKEKQLWPEMKYSTEMKEVTVTNSEEIFQYIDNYQNIIVADK